jgi:hypothetical protein
MYSFEFEGVGEPPCSLIELAEVVTIAKQMNITGLSELVSKIANRAMTPWSGYHRRRAHLQPIRGRRHCYELPESLRHGSRPRYVCSGTDPDERPSSIPGRSFSTGERGLGGRGGEEERGGGGGGGGEPVKPGNAWQFVKTRYFQSNRAARCLVPTKQLSVVFCNEHQNFEPVADWSCMSGMSALPHNSCSHVRANRDTFCSKIPARSTLVVHFSPNTKRTFISQDHTHCRLLKLSGMLIMGVARHLHTSKRSYRCESKL